MQAISKQDHEKFCQAMQNIKMSQSLKDKNLVELETDLETVFKTYQQQLNDLKALIMEYDTKKKAMRNKVKQLLREVSFMICQIILFGTDFFCQAYTTFSDLDFS